MAILSSNAGQLFLLLLLVFYFFALTYQPLDVGFFVKVQAYQILSESLVENQAMVVLVETFSVNAHKSEELGIDHFLCLKDAHLIWKNLAQICCHFLWFFIQ